MKIGIIGDVHIGASYSLGKTDPETQLNSRLLDYANTFNFIIDTFVKNKVSTVILTGDVFESKHPTTAQLNIFSKCLKRATDFGLKVPLLFQAFFPSARCLGNRTCSKS